MRLPEGFLVMRRAVILGLLCSLALLIPTRVLAQSGTWSNIYSPIGADQPPEPCDPDAVDPEEPDEPGNAIPCAPAVGVFGSWAAPVGAQTPLVLMDGSVFVHQARSLNWWKLYPDSNG